MEETITFATWLAAELKTRKITMSRFAKNSKISDGTVSKHLRGVITPTAKTLKIYAAALNVPVAELYKIVGYYDEEEKPINRRDKLFRIFTELSIENKRKLVEVAKNMLENQR